MFKFHKKIPAKKHAKNRQKTRKKTSEKRRNFDRTRSARSRADLVRISRSLAQCCARGSADLDICAGIPSNGARAAGNFYGMRFNAARCWPDLRRWLVMYR